MLMRKIQEKDGTTFFSVFETPIMVRFLKDHETLNPVLERSILEMEQDPETYQEKGRWFTKFGKLFESHFDILSEDKPGMRALRDHCFAAISDIAGAVNGRAWKAQGIATEDLRIGLESWFHVTRSGARHALHKHGNHSWSGVYYVRRGDRSAENPQDGFFRLYDPRPNISMYQDMGMIPFGTTGIDIEPEDGKMLIFPSWMQHEVLTYHGESPRLCVAFNATITLREGFVPKIKPQGSA